MSADKQELWRRIKAFEIGDTNSEFSFTDRLARENGWTLEYAIRTILEYKKFMFLICLAEHPLTPSDQVDQVWHLHLIYTESYWIEFCKNTIKRHIHHGPTKGGGDEKRKFHNGYEATKELYKLTFKTEPPTDIWPSGAVRFGQIRFIRVNLHTHWVIPKLVFLKKWKL